MTETHVYFIRAGQGAIKIGIARDPRKRLFELQVGTSDELRILHTIPGTEDTERALHERFAHLRLRGEWFRAGFDLLRFIADRMRADCEAACAALVASADVTACAPTAPPSPAATPERKPRAKQSVAELSPNQMLTTEQAAAFLGLKPQTLRKWRLHGSGPPYVRLGSGTAARAAYRHTDVEAWVSARHFSHTSAETAGKAAR
jgi:predicted DNA-binding transcriptional regulator AlpA